MSSLRRWTLEAAQQILPEVRRRTRRAVESTEQLIAERSAEGRDAGEREALEARIQGEVSRWAREMEALGLDVKGIWLVDFDTGDGCYCWKWPEERVEYFHTQQEGFAGRTRIQ